MSVIKLLSLKMLEKFKTYLLKIIHPIRSIKCVADNISRLVKILNRLKNLAVNFVYNVMKDVLTNTQEVLLSSQRDIGE